jgi:hypothetical protein
MAEPQPIERNEFFELYCEAPAMDTYEDEIRVQQAMEIAFEAGYKKGSQDIGRVKV